MNVKKIIKKSVWLLITMFSFTSYSQIKFEKGYIIDNSNKTISCLIKNEDWRNTPHEFEYKLSENEKAKIGNLESVKEFGIESISKYVRCEVKIDISSENINKLSSDKEPDFKIEKVFLKVLVEGKSNLYEYFDNNLKRFFYKSENTSIIQLVFKSYLTEDEKVGKNNKFRQQLWLDLKCPDITMSKIEKVGYNRNDLISFFTEYSKCENANVFAYKQKQENFLFNLNLRPRVNRSSLTLQTLNTDFRSVELERKTFIGYGIEAEFLLPFQKNKWGLFIEAIHNSFKAEKTSDTDFVVGGKVKAKVNYSFTQFPIGLRHYFFLNKNSKIFVNTAFVYEFNNKSSIDYTRDDDSLLSSFEINSTHNFAFGFGYNLYNRFTLEARFDTDKKLINYVDSLESKFNTFSLIVGYTLF